MMFSLRPHQQRGLESMANHSKGQLIMPTGAGKTPTMIFDAQREFQSQIAKTIVVVAPRILLATQLCSEFLEFITNAEIFHCHSGDVHWKSSTHVSKIKKWNEINRGRHKLIFTTYHSLKKLEEVDIDVNTIYFDEAHNSVKRNFFPSTEYFSANASRCYFFTATRKTSETIFKPGMNDVDVYGDIIFRVSAPELVNSGYIVPPKVLVKKFDIFENKHITAENDRDNLLSTLDESGSKKVMICVKTTKQLTRLFSETDFGIELNRRGYSHLYITSKTGAVINGKKVGREEFFRTLNSWGKDLDKKFVVLQRSIMSEGINVSELESVFFLRNMDVVEMVQTVGRVLRKASESKTFGLCVVPVYSNIGIATERALQSVVDTVFGRGEMLDSVIKK